MSEKIFHYLKMLCSSRTAWLLVVVNLIFFAYLFEEIKYIQEASVGYCDEKGRHFALVNPSNFFQIFVLLNLPATIISGVLSEIIFWNFNDSCINYSYDKYPFVYIGKTGIMLLCQSIQWFIVGYIAGYVVKKTYRSLKEY